MENESPQPCTATDTGAGAIAGPVGYEAEDRLAYLDPIRTMALAIWGGACCALGASFYTVMLAGGEPPHALPQPIAGLALGVGLAFAGLLGAQVFAATDAITSPWLTGRLGTADYARGCAIIYAGNLLGGLLLAWLTYAAAQYVLGTHGVGLAAMRIAADKCEMPFTVAVVRGLLGSIVLCLGFWLACRAKTMAGKVLTVIMAATVFVSCGFEHCVPNMYLVPAGLFLQWAGAVGVSEPSLSLGAFVGRCLVPCTIGNAIGAGLTMGGLYWIVHAGPASPTIRRTRRPRSRRRPRRDLPEDAAARPDPYSPRTSRGHRSD